MTILTGHPFLEHIKSVSFSVLIFLFYFIFYLRKERKNINLGWVGGEENLGEMEKERLYVKKTYKKKLFIYLKVHLLV